MMKKIIFSISLIITSFFFINNVGASSNYFVLDSAIRKQFYDMNPASDDFFGSSYYDETNYTKIMNYVNNLSNNNYYILYTNGDYYNIYSWSKSYNNNVYLNFQKTSSNIYSSFIFNQDDVQFSTSNIVSFKQYYRSSSAGYSKSSRSQRSMDFMGTEYSLSTGKMTANNRIVSTNIENFYYHSYKSVSSWSAISSLSINNDDNTMCLAVLEKDSIIFKNSVPNWRSPSNMKFGATIKNYDIFNHLVSENITIKVDNYNSDDYIYAYQFLEDDDDEVLSVSENDLIKENWITFRCRDKDEEDYYYHIVENINHKGKLYVAYWNREDMERENIIVVNHLNIITQFERYTTIDLKGKLGIYLMPKTIDGAFDTTFYFKDEIHDFRIFYYMIDNSSGGNLDVSSLKYATMNKFDYSSSEYGPQYGDKVFTISKSFLENVDYLIYFKRRDDITFDNDYENKDKHYYISFESDKFNYQVVEKDKEDDIKIINPNTGEDVNIDNMNVNLFTTLKNGVDMFKGKIANIFKLVSYMFECLPNIIQTFFIVMLFFIVLLLVFKLLM